jgi:hypothetical protein
VLLAYSSGLSHIVTYLEEQLHVQYQEYLDLRGMKVCDNTQGIFRWYSSWQIGRMGSAAVS